MRLEVRIPVILVVTIGAVLPSVSLDQVRAQQAVRPAPRLHSPPLGSTLPSMTPSLGTSPGILVAPPLIQSRPGGCPEGPPCPPQTVAPDMPAVRPGGCPEGDPCPNKQ
jgi:hypothetical protein